MATASNEFMLHHETIEQISSPVASNRDYPDSEMVESVCGDALKLDEEEFRRRIELEAEERKLEETLEYQRRIEDEAKQKHLAEQHKKTARIITENHSDDDQDAHKQLKHYKQEPLTPENGFPNGLEGVPYRAAQRIGNTAGHFLAEVKQGLPNGRIPEDVLSNDQQTGRKGRRYKNSAKSNDISHRPLWSEKENIEVGHVKDSLHPENRKALFWSSAMIFGNLDDLSKFLYY
ncbi:hypothetical protein U1Q18_025829 [Sarracenia purpurea var. burkii]